MLVIAFSINAKITPEWIRYAAISPNGQDIVFTYKGDLYRVPTAGGEAKQLTFHKAHDYNAVWSNDGSQLAFASDRHGNFDIFTMDALGGKATRLSFHSSNEVPYAFAKDDTAIVFKGQRMDAHSHRQYPSSRFEEVYSVPVSGGRVAQLLTTPAENIDISKDGNTFVYQDYKGTENYWRKHHKSAVTRDIWTYNTQTKKHKKITKFEGEDRNPVFTDNDKSIYYLSAESGTFNVHKLSLRRPSSTKQLTDFTVHPVRFLSEGNGVLAFTYHGELFTMKEGEKPSKVQLSIRTQDIENATNLVNVDGDISEMSTSHDGKQIAFVSNGDVFVTSSDGAFTKQITQTPETEAFVSFSKEDDAVIYASERNGNWGIYKTGKTREQEPFFYAATLLNESSVLSGNVDYTQPLFSPDGKKLAFIEDRKTLRVLDLESKSTKTLVASSEMLTFRAGDKDFSWSPDSKWLLFVHEKLLNNTDIAIVKADGTDMFKTLIPSAYYDFSPKWVNDGKQILWFSNRHGLRSYATSGTSQLDVYSLFLTQAEWDEYRLSENDYNLLQTLEEVESDDKEETDAESAESEEESTDEPEIEDIEIQWDNVDERIAKLTIHSSALSDAVLNQDADTLYYLTKFEGQLDLWKTNLRTQETEKAISLYAENASLQWDQAMETLYLLSDGGISTIDLDSASSEGIFIDSQMVQDDIAVRQSSFDHVWLRTSKTFYEPTYHGVNWTQMYDEYRPKVSHVSNTYEFTELLSEMLGELNVSHSGAGYRNFADGGDDTASLGIFYDDSVIGQGIKITEIIENGPLDKAKFDITSGAVITAIDGVDLSADMDWSKLLNRKAGKLVLLSILNSDGETKEYTVRPISIGAEEDLLYDRFVEINEQEVLKKSKGKLGYVHIPGMSDGPYRNVFDIMLGRHFDKQGMVIDTRFNGGGDLVADLAMFFTGEKFLTYATQERVVGGEPTSRYTKPVISLFNESMYSDGHCYASGYKDLKIGKSVGMPVPGTCSFAGWESLPLGGYWGFVPISAKNKRGEWLENNQTEPDIMLSNAPEDIATGTDQQLQRAIKELLKQVK